MYFKQITSICLFVLFFGTMALFSQSHFQLPGKKDKLRFELVNNLVIVPVELNGVELSFLLDTGVENTILFSLEERDTLELHDARAINLRGLGQGQPLVAYKSDNNRFSIGKAVNRHLSIYVIFNKQANFSPRLGIPVHGIIGHDFFKDFIVNVNYQREFIKFYNPKDYHKKCRGCARLPLSFYNNKPYLEAEIKILGEKVTSTLLIDSGASDALWLYPKDKIAVPPDYFEDFLGFGLSGSIYGKRSKIEAFSMGKYNFKRITTAFPDSLATSDFNENLLKDGLIGGELLKRFDWVIDYPNQQLFFEPNSYFEDPFHYDMSGIVVQYNGLQVVKEFEYVDVGKLNQGIQLESENNFKRTSYKVKFSIKPQMEIAEIRPGSPAENAGLKKGDILVKINKREAHRYTLIELYELFSSEPGKKIKIEINREGNSMTREFRLEQML